MHTLGFGEMNFMGLLHFATTAAAILFCCCTPALLLLLRFATAAATILFYCCNPTLLLLLLQRFATAAAGAVLFGSSNPMTATNCWAAPNGPLDCTKLSRWAAPTEVASSLPRQNYHTVSPEDLRKSYLADAQPKPLGYKSLIEGQPILSFNEDETNTLAAQFRFALVGKFSHGASPYRMMHKLIAGLGVSGGFTVRMINVKHILIQLSTETDYTRLWLRRIWTIQGFPMHIFKWDPTFNPSQESSVVPLWVEFPELPVHLFQKDALFAVANMVGTPLQLDDYTVNQATLTCAKVFDNFPLNNAASVKEHVTVNNDIASCSGTKVNEETMNELLKENKMYPVGNISSVNEFFLCEIECCCEGVAMKVPLNPVSSKIVSKEGCGNEEADCGWGTTKSPCDGDSMGDDSNWIQTGNAFMLLDKLTGEGEFVETSQSQPEDDQNTENELGDSELN
ncbi:UNVERIFIED_CONTAM: hypothetical protein Scaly_1031700 [Sesamum calycinum]|uniref:DUF4283 domain-containing protein n=1 Tax=Sesamum calycinum TaxID=2727403 RepID=A0AAW2QJZ4_9LAMI